MFAHVRANLNLLLWTLGLCCVVYPLILWVIGQSVFPGPVNGSLVLNEGGEPIGSQLIAQPFTADEYFQPRPSAASYNAAASGASNWGPSNYLLRERVARALGPIVKYGNRSSKKGQLVGPDIDVWFQQDRYQGKPGIVAQWAQLHSAAAQGWVKADKANATYIAQWQQAHLAEVAAWIKANPDNAEPKPEDLVVPFFESYSRTHPGTFPSLVEHKTPDGKVDKRMEPVQAGNDIRGIFFDMWRQEHPDADLEEVPADLVMASGSGLDPHITLKNAQYQLDRVAAAWAAKTGLDPKGVRQEIEALLAQDVEAPLRGLVGVPLINVLTMNLKLQQNYGTKVKAQASAK